MKCKSLVALTLLLLSGSALASEQKFQSVQVRPEASTRLAFECASQQAARPADVERLLNINDRSQTAALGHKLSGAVEEACNAGVPYIVVTRGKSGGSLTWAPARDASYASIALR